MNVFLTEQLKVEKHNWKMENIEKVENVISMWYGISHWLYGEKGSIF